jgi:hypothetical protein
MFLRFTKQTTVITEGYRSVTTFPLPSEYWPGGAR